MAKMRQVVEGQESKVRHHSQATPRRIPGNTCPRLAQASHVCNEHTRTGNCHSKCVKYPPSFRSQILTNCFRILEEHVSQTCRATYAASGLHKAIPFSFIFSVSGSTCQAMRPHQGTGQAQHNFRALAKPASACISSLVGHTRHQSVVAQSLRWNILDSPCSTLP